MGLFGIRSTLRAAALLITVLVLAIQGCASMVIRQVEEADKDQTGTYDGSWSALIQKAPGTQYGPGNWTFSCNSNPGNLGVISVTDGVASFRVKDKVHTAFVGQSGQFRFEAPLEIKAKASGTSDTSVDRNQMTLIVVGSLAEQEGSVTWGIAEFGNDGCTSKLKFAQA